ncbi:uncharacterized protein LOC124113918 [Haliotis rufescens]|uniref:uncharacterized protein LOC124113918 n=1 Tax=Haliotis rufescens TaxID=6454 RepID=UPI00201EE0E7|nr:uncharacterized protein LOC124113918 [Haliotis rufescens]XP_046330366.2 uncharacterized protein LOC124113918 [Haliotis rufescens]
MSDNMSASVASYLSLGRDPLSQLSSLVTRTVEGGFELTSLSHDEQFSSLTSDDDLIILDEEDDLDDQQQLTIERASINASVCTDSVQPLLSSVTASVRNVGNKNDTVQTSHPIPLSPIQQQYLQDRDTARQTLCYQLETKGFKATFRFQQREVDIESRREKKHKEALDVIASSVVEMELNFSSGELEQMSQVAGIPDGEVILPQLSSDQDVLAVIDKTNGSMKLVGMADTIKALKETINKSQELLDTRHKNQEEQGSQSTSASIPGDTEQRGASAQVQASLYPSISNHPWEENPAIDIAPITNFVRVDDDSLDYLCQYKGNEMRMIGEEEGVAICETAHGYEVKGPAAANQRAVIKLRNHVEGVKCNKFTFETAVNMGNFAEATGNASKNHNCIIGYKQTIGTTRGRARQQPPVLESSTTGKQKAKVTVVLNRIENQNANVIVNTTNKELKLSEGRGVSYSLVQEAGEDIQQVLTDIYPHGMTYGDLAVSHCGRLTNCEKIYHGALPYHTGNTETMALFKCYEWLVSLVFRCLIQACKDGFQTIALPAFGTGALQYPTKNVVQLMYHAIDLFTQDERAGSLKEIFIVISRESRLEVKQLFLAHRLSHKLKTRHLANPRGQTSYLSHMFRLWFGTGQDFGLPAYLSQEIQNSPKCEVRIMVADTLVQAINGGVVEACDVTGAVLLIWRMEDITNPNDHAGLTCINRDRHDWDCCREHVADLKRTSCVADTTTVPGTTLIHTYSRSVSEASVSEALQRGLRLAAKEGCYHVTVPLPSEGSLAARPDQSASAIASAINRRPCGVYVVTVIIPDNDIYVGIVTRIASCGIVQEPPDVDKVSLVDSLWKVTFSRQQNLAAMLNTAVDAVMVVTSDSEETNRNAARDVERELHVHLNDVVYSRRQ